MTVNIDSVVISKDQQTVNDSLSFQKFYHNRENSIEKYSIFDESPSNVFPTVARTEFRKFHLNASQIGSVSSGMKTLSIRCRKKKLIKIMTKHIASTHHTFIPDMICVHIELSSLNPFLLIFYV